jgi:hypothetical protein
MGYIIEIVVYSDPAKLWRFPHNPQSTNLGNTAAPKLRGKRWSEVSHSVWNWNVGKEKGGKRASGLAS